MRAFAILLLVSSLGARAFADDAAGEEAAFRAAAKLYREAKQDRSGSADAFRRFAERFPRSARAGDAYFTIAEIAFDRGLSLADADSSFSRDRINGRIPDSALKSFAEAEEAYDAALKRAADDGLKSTARYRLGEVAYNRRDWAKAAREFEAAAATWPKSYVVPASLLGLVYSALAREDFVQAEAWLSKLGEAYPDRLKEPAAAFVRGVLALHKGDYAQAERLLDGQATPEARYYLGKTYLLWQKPLLAATVFNKLAEDNAVLDLREAASFFLGDAFFMSKDYDGAIDRYSAFVKAYPFSRFKVAAMYRIGSSSFQKGDYGQARLSFGSLLSQYPNDFYASLARYFIGESHLVVDQMREALFSYAEVVANGRKDLQPQALYRLAWAQQSLGDYARAATTCQTFMDAYPTHALAKNVLLVLGNSEARLKRKAPALAAFQRILDCAPGTEVAEQALFLMLKLQYDQKDYNSILTSYQYILRQLPQSLSKWRALSYLTAAETYVRLDRTEEAKTIYEMVLKVYANDLSSVYAQDGLAWCYELSGRHKEALEARHKLAELLKVENSTFSFAAVNELGIADSFYAQKDYTDAYTFYDKFAADHPESPALAPALYRAGFSLYHLKYYGQAVEIWQKLLEKAPASPEADKASYQIADTLFRARKTAEAAAAYKRILEKAPKGPQAPLAALRLAQLSYFAGQDDEALAQIKSVVLDFPSAGEAVDALDLAEGVFDRAPQRGYQAFLAGLVEADPRGAAAGEVQFRLGRRLYDHGEFAAAAKALQRFSVDYTGHPSLAKAQLLLGECRLQEGKHSEAAAAFERFVVNFPQAEELPLALFKLGSAQFSLKQYGKAAAAFEKLLADHPKSEYAKPARFNLAIAYRNDSQLDSAATAYANYIASGASEDEAQSARWELVSIAKDRKDYKGALKVLEEIRAKAKPGSDAAAQAAYQAGEIAAASGDADAALAAWQAAASLGPAGNPYRLEALVKLAEIYEKKADWSKAIAAYDDLARNAGSSKTAGAARDRIRELKRSASPAAAHANQ